METVHGYISGTDCFDNRASAVSMARRRIMAPQSRCKALARPLPGLSVSDSERGFGGEPAG